MLSPSGQVQTRIPLSRAPLLLFPLSSLCLLPCSMGSPSPPHPLPLLSQGPHGATAGRDSISLLSDWEHRPQPGHALVADPEWMAGRGVLRPWAPGTQTCVFSSPFIMTDSVCTRLRTEGKTVRRCGRKRFSLDSPELRLLSSALLTFGGQINLVVHGAGWAGGTMLCATGCFPASLVSPASTLASFPHWVNQKCLQGQGRLGDSIG